jgi:hypothetical protein
MNALTKSHAIIKTAADLQRAGLTQIDYILLDGSSSMHDKLADALGSIDTYAGELLTNGVKTNIHVASFSNYSDFHYDTFASLTPDQWESVRGFRIRGGSTPLYDAINTMCRELRDLNPEKASVLIYTDGEENCSKTTVEQARALLDWCRAKGWQVTFIGCDFNNLRSAAALGANASTAIGTSARRLTDVTRELAKKRSNYDKYGSEIEFNDAEKQQFGGYLSYNG